VLTADCVLRLPLQSRQVAQDLIADAKAALSGYDPAKAAPLIGLAEYILGRQN
jgi:DNA anti-recombination protein RmuC